MKMKKSRRLAKISEIPEYVLAASELEDVAVEIVENEAQMKNPLDTSINSAISCSFCKEQFTDSHSICHHLIFNHFQSLSRCLNCSRLFTEIDKLNKHVAKHSSTVSKLVFKCSSCTMSFYNQMLLKKHEIKHKNTDPNNGVYLDDLNTSLTEILRMNIKDFIKNLHVPEPKYNCVTCKMIFFNLALFFQHLQETHAKNVDNKAGKIFVCDKCCAVYSNKSALANHIFKIHKSEGKTFMCDYCKKEFDEKINLTLHVRKIHKIYKCSKCNNEYQKNRCYLQHLSKCLGKRQKKLFRCVDCNITFKTPNDLYVHNQICNKKMLDIKDCRFCRISLPNGGALKMHEQRHELRIATYKYQCFYCQLRFSVPLRLIQHFAGKHRTEKPFKCNICNVTFKKRKEFTYHIKLDHKMEGTVKIDNVSCYILFNALDANHTKEQEVSLVILSETQKDDASGINEELKNPIDKNKECTSMTENKEANVESCAGNSPRIESIPFATNDAVLEQNICRLSPDPKLYFENKSTESLTIDKNDEICEYCNKKVLKSKFKKHLDTQHGDRVSKNFCFICKQNLRTRSSLNKHVENHFRAEAKSCLERVTTNQQSLEDHVVKIHPNKDESTVINLKPKILMENVPNINCQIIIENKLKNINNDVKFKRDIDTKNVFKVHMKKVVGKTEPAMNLRKYVESFSSNKPNNNNIILTSPSSNVVLKRITQPIVEQKKFTLQTFKISSNSESYQRNRMLAKPVKFTNNAKLKLTKQLNNSNVNSNIDLKFNAKQTPQANKQTNTQANTANHVTEDATEETLKMVDVSYYKYLEALEKRGTSNKQKKERGKVFDYVSIIANGLSDTALSLKKK